MPDVLLWDVLAAVAMLLILVAAVGGWVRGARDHDRRDLPDAEADMTSYGIREADNDE